MDAARKSAIYGDKELLKHMAMACTGFPVEKRDKCQEFLNNDQKELLLLLKSDLSSRAVASALGFCSGFEDFVPHPLTSQAIALLKQDVCATLKYEELINLCNQLVDAYVGTAFNIVYQQLNPQDICTILKLCSSDSRDVPMEKLQHFFSYMMQVPKVKSDAECAMCLNATKMIQDELRDGNIQKKLEDVLENGLCSLLPTTAATECKSYVATYAPLVFEVLVSELDPQTFCDEVKLCPAPAIPKSNILATALKVQGLPTCALCEEVLKRLEEMLPEKAIEQDVVAALDQVCSRLTGDISAKCNALVQEYGPKIIQIILAEGPAAVCTGLGLCVGQKHLEVVSLGSPLTNVHVMGPKKETSSVGCTLCELVTTKLYEILGNNKTESVIEKALENACNVVPAEYVAECTAYVQQYTQLIIQLIEAGASPEVVCSKLGLCSQKVSVPVSPEKKIKGPDVLCELCKIVVQKAEEFLQQNKTEQEIEGELDKLCSLLPSSDSCKQMVNEYLPTIIILLKQELTPDAVCQQLSLCTTAVNVAVSSEKEMKGSAISCDMCKILAEKVDKVLEQNTTEAEITDVLVKACGFLKGDLNARCISFVDEYGPMIVKLIAQEITTAEICYSLKLCLGKGSQAVRPHVAASSGDDCLICKEIINSFNQALEDPSTEKNIEDLMLSGCNSLPAGYQNMCSDLVQSYFPELVAMLTQNDLEVCTMLKLCTNATQPSRPVQKSSPLIFKPMSEIRKPLLGQEKCTYGPSYWCASKENAHQCNVPIEHCIEMKLMKKDDV
ncbi:hypothetical protein C0Q70_01380 [Pomacea canaliculata]|uniref:Prosaposin n=1 Tax=Pomacea canaliculata TaxID=400727 RepID=A0A2T7PZD4_POMCA|nr:hypothetical protein C0Q70_01380 [Pomacea canaliculata]